jgi:hypothetical protein
MAAISVPCPPLRQPKGRHRVWSFVPQARAWIARSIQPTFPGGEVKRTVPSQPERPSVPGSRLNRPNPSSRRSGDPEPSRTSPVTLGPRFRGMTINRFANRLILTIQYQWLDWVLILGRIDIRPWRTRHRARDQDSGSREGEKKKYLAQRRGGRREVLHADPSADAAPLSWSPRSLRLCANKILSSCLRMNL